MFIRRMSVIMGPLFLVLICLWKFTRGDVADAVCVLEESCLLKCSFKPGDDVLIHWLLVKDNIPVHSFYDNEDQLLLQDERFLDRTFLFKDQLSEGNASLLLKEVQIQDQGRYKCYTSTITGNHNILIDLNVEAPVRKVDIQKVENQITCSSEGIYPEPKLTWTTTPLSNGTFKNTTTVIKTEEQLYSISSSLVLPDSGIDLLYSCNISTRTHSRRGNLLKTTSISGSDRESTIPCAPSKRPLTSLIWKFNHSEIILTQIRSDVPYTVSERWVPQVKDVSEAGSLTLQSLASSHEGIYSCELSDAEETYVSNTFLRMEQSQGNNNTAVIVGLVVVFLLTLLSVVIGVWYKRIYQKKRDQRASAVI